jgi:hypothetical protein
LGIALFLNLGILSCRGAFQMNLRVAQKQSPMGRAVSSEVPDCGWDVRVVERLPTWRGQPYSLTYLLPEQEVSAPQLVGLHLWALERNLPNPRVIAPSTLLWSSLFNPRFFASVDAQRDDKEPRLFWVRPADSPRFETLPRVWLESTLFLAGVTLSAAVIQSRFSAGTIASKYDRLWEAGVLANEGVAPELQKLDLRETVSALAADAQLTGVDRLLAIRQKYMQAYALIAPSDGAVEEMLACPLPTTYADRFGFIDDLRKRCGPDLRALIVYGSSVSSKDFADYDLLVVTDHPESLLRRLAGQSPTWHGKEMNLGVYSPEEVLTMQRLSGDNLGSYGVCLWGRAPIVQKPVSGLLVRNFSFGFIRQRQQLGMLSRATSEPVPADGDDRRNLHEYFVKIPANVAKGTLGAMGERWPKEQVHAWMLREFGFDTVAEQRRATTGNPVFALASSVLATGKVLAALNERVNLVKTCRRTPGVGEEVSS